MDYIKLFEPISINNLEIKNRIVMPAMGLSYTDNYEFNDRFRGFYRERARGGVGLMTIGPVAIDKAGSAPLMPKLFDDENIEPLKNFIGELHKETMVKLATQLFHMGRYAFSAFTGLSPIAPSPIPSKLTRETPREMTKEDIEEIKTAYADAARRAKAADFDFVEILACTGYLISQFLSPITNKRTDEYGGSIENRMRFGLEVIREVRKAVGDDFPVGIRIAGNDFMEGGHTNKESSLFAAEAENASIDAVNVTGGWHETSIPQLTTNVPPGAYLYLAKGIKEKVNVPVFASNRLGDQNQAERALRSGRCDMICWARPLIADPELPNKIQEGRLDEIVPCIACNQGCFDSIFSGTSVCCVLNPRAGRENDFIIEPATSKKKIMVAGGGPAGMEFAITAAKRGHDVTLYEKENDLGGQLNLAKSPPGKGEFQNFIDSMKNRMSRWGAKIKLGKNVTPELIKKNSPDVLVVASRAKPITLDIPGKDMPHVFNAWDVLLEKVYDIGENVVIIGGNATGCETAHFISAMGIPDAETFTFLMYHSAEEQDFAKNMLHDSSRKITVLEMAGRMAENVGRTGRWSLMKSLRMMGVNLRTKTRLIEIKEDHVIIEDENGKSSIPADTVIMAVGAVSDDTLSQTFTDTDMTTIIIGDAKTPRKIPDAVREGFEAALTV
ncbi:MAG: FAD-dependent oxidoreductase [Deltaproteobacteria bacterium]|nr:FAD-dependent oxidoreductase [Deltaproteobacteria bacterium]